MFILYKLKNDFISYSNKKSAFIIYLILIEKTILIIYYKSVYFS